MVVGLAFLDIITFSQCGCTSGCTSTDVGQSVRHLTTRIEEHKKADSPAVLMEIAHILVRKL